TTRRVRDSSITASDALARPRWLQATPSRHADTRIGGSAAVPSTTGVEPIGERDMARRNQTDVVEDLVRRYLKEIGAYELLTAEDEVELGKILETAAEAGETLAGATRLARGERARLTALVTAGHEARQRSIQSNLRLAVSLAKRYQSSGLPLLDLVQEGNLGLMRAVEKFDYRKGFKFSTYATWWIRQAITRAIADKGRTIRVPVHMVETVAQVGRSAARLARSLGREATLDEVAADSGLPVEKAYESLRVSPEPVSLFEHMR